MEPKITAGLFSQVPQLHVRTNSYRTLGYTVGRTFGSLIHDTLQKSDFLEILLIPAYETEQGKRIYDNALELCRKKFPQYVDELEGMAEGAVVSFHKLFLLHIDSILLTPVSTFTKKTTVQTADRGCTDILSFPDSGRAYLGHNEDGAAALRNNIFILSAEIVDKSNSTIVLEKFSTIVYAGCLPGGTMGFNEHGIIHSMNTLVPNQTFQNGTPILFLTRALLCANSLEDFISILRDEGTGSSDGGSLNVIYLKEKDSTPVVVNIEVAPSSTATLSSVVNVLDIKVGDSYEHCNRYLRLDVEEQPRTASSISRHEAIENYSKRKPYCFDTIGEILSDITGGDYPIFRDGDASEKDVGYTLLVCIADLEKRTWSLYVGQPTTCSPVVVIPMNFIFDV